MRFYDLWLRLVRALGLLSPAVLVGSVVLSFTVASLQLGRIPRPHIESADNLGDPAATVAFFGLLAHLLSPYFYMLAVPALAADLLVARERRAAAVWMLGALAAGAAAVAFLQLDLLSMSNWFLDD